MQKPPWEGVTRQSCPLTSGQLAGKAEEGDEPGVQPKPRAQLADKEVKEEEKEAREREAEMERTADPPFVLSWRKDSMFSPCEEVRVWPNISVRCDQIRRDELQQKSPQRGDFHQSSQLAESSGPWVSSSPDEAAARWSWTAVSFCLRPLRKK